MSSRPRRPRRAVRPSGTVGADESVLHTRLPAVAPGAGAAAGGAARAKAGPAAPGAPVAAGAPAASPEPEDLWRATRAADDSDRGWGREEPSSNDDRLRREKPPHW